MFDVIVVGAGPAGSLAALLFARQGARVRLLDRARFPRDKLCGDTLNPGALRVLAQHVDITPVVARGLAIDGMRLTGPTGASICGRYGQGLMGRAITRRELDAWLLEQALAAGVDFTDGVTVTRPLIDERGDTSITGVHIRSSTGASDMLRAPLVIGADGRRSVLAASVRVARQPRRPRRWAVGAYFESVDGLQSLGEMHVRHGRYIGVAPLPDGRANACLVESWHPIKGCPTPSIAGDAAAWRDPGARLRQALASDPLLGPRFARARAVSAPTVLGPMAIDVARPGAPGLLLAGDAAGFIDPMTGDGLRYAFVGAELAASVGADVLAGAIARNRAAQMLATRRRAILSAKWRFNRALRHIVSWPIAIAGAGLLARVTEAPFQAIIRYAGDIYE